MSTKELLYECLKLITFEKTSSVEFVLTAAYIEIAKKLTSKTADELLSIFLGSMELEMNKKKFSRRDIPPSFIPSAKTEIDLQIELKQTINIRSPEKLLDFYGSLGGAYILSVPVEIFVQWERGLGKGLGKNELNMSQEEEIIHWWNYWWFYTWLGY